MVPADLNALASGSLATAALLGVVGAYFAVSFDSHRPAMIAATFASAAIAVTGLAGIAGADVGARLGEVLGYGLLDARLDALSGLFLLALGIVGVAASLYAVGYHDAGRSRVDALAYVVFLTSLGLVFLAANAFSFLFAWELMALASTALVIGPAPDRSMVRAGYIYLAMTHLGTAAITIAFGLLSSTAGSLAFADWHAAGQTMGGAPRDILFILLLIGFGMKAGMVPLHIWLPRAHPAAPSHVSALMSGVMIKAGVFGIVRFGLETMGAGPGWWGLVLLALGAASAVLGVLYALAEHDLKRLLAFHSVENIGIILIGLGVAFIGQAEGVSALVIVGLAAGLFHTLNHAVFKALLFLGAGAVQSAAGNRDLNRLGGLARLMPLTAVTFGLGAAAISGLPPLNGFASEWLTFQGLLSLGGATDAGSFVRFAGYLAIGALALTVALAVACFVKATGMTFLAMPRTTAAAEAREVGYAMRAGMVGLAIVCVGVGIAAGPIGGVLAGVAATVLQPASTAAGRVTPLPTLGGYDPALIAVVLVVLVVAILSLMRLGSQPVRRTPTWTCGMVPEPAFEYTATSFSKPLRLFFEPLLRPERLLHVELHEGTPVPRRITYRSEVDHMIETRLYAPLHRASIVLAQVARRLQQGTLQLYLAYTVGAVVILLLVARR